MHYSELNNVLFNLKYLNEPPNNFSILDFVSFSSNATQSGGTHKMNHTLSSSYTTGVLQS